MLEHNWHEIGEPASEAEALALDALRCLLPDDPLCHAWANLEFPDSTGHINEIDLLLLARQGLFVLELKGWGGKVTGRLNDWRVTNPPGHVRPERSPVTQTDKKAKRLRGLLQRESGHLRERVRIPYLAPIAVFHGRGSTLDLSDATKGPVVGLDGFGVKGVPAFTHLLQRPCRDQPLDKIETDAFVRLLERCGLAPRTPRPAAASSQSPVVNENTKAPDASPTAAEIPSAPEPLFRELTDDELAALGVHQGDLGVVRAAVDIEAIIGRVPDAVWDDLEAVAGGEPMDVVVDRRQAANAILAQVDARAHTAGRATSESDGSEQHDAPAAPQLADDSDGPGSSTDAERKLKEAFGDRVHRRASVVEEVTPPEPVVQEPPPQSLAALAYSVPAESLLALARTEVLAGRTAGGRALHSEVRQRLEEGMTVDWSVDDVDDLAASLAGHRSIVQRLRNLTSELRSGDLPDSGLVEVPTGVRNDVGSLWFGSDIGPAYSLLIRVPDVLDRRSGLFLSQVVGPETAANVNQRLRAGRPDGGRIHLTSDGTVVSRRDPVSAWFVVGYVSAEEWFPQVRVVKSPRVRVQS